MLMKESIGADANFGTPCLLSGNTNGTCANYRWYNLCSGYIWIYHGWPLGAGVGVLFGGQEQPCVAPGNVVKRAITYYRNTAPTYACRIAVSLERDVEGDGCPDGSLASECFDPSLRWNCSEFNQTIPEGTEYLIVRQYKADQSGLDYLPGFATDGPFNQGCEPLGAPRSFAYAADGTCQPWSGPTDRADNFLTWLIVDGEVPNALSTSSWGAIKGLFR
jgi:hypothetical protein